MRPDTLGEQLRNWPTNMSGDMVLELALAEDGEIRMESVSGDLRLQLPADLSAQVSGKLQW